MKNMTFLLEEQLESFIFDNKESIHKLGLPKLYKNLIRQFRLPNGKIIDLFNYEIVEDILYFKIIELKRDHIFHESVGQIIGYFGTCANLSRNKMFKGFEYELLLIGATIPNTALSAIKIIDKLKVFRYSFDVNGLNFIEHTDYSTTCQNNRNWSDVFCETLIEGNIADELGYMKEEVIKSIETSFIK